MSTSSHTRIGFPMSFLALCIWQMLLGIAYMHHHRLVHRDVKGDNFLFSGDENSKSANQLKLIDFGFSVRLRRGRKLRKQCGTVHFVAPEVLDQLYDEKCDVWGVG